MSRVKYKALPFTSNTVAALSDFIVWLTNTKFPTLSLPKGPSPAERSAFGGLSPLGRGFEPANPAARASIMMAKPAPLTKKASPVGSNLARALAGFANAARRRSRITEMIPTIATNTANPPGARNALYACILVSPLRGSGSHQRLLLRRLRRSQSGIAERALAVEEWPLRRDHRQRRQVSRLPRLRVAPIIVQTRFRCAVRSFS
jgi:hypothetical protein